MNVLQDEKGISLTANGSGIYTIQMKCGQNVVNPEFVDMLSNAIEKFEKVAHPKSLILTGDGKFFSNGLDLNFLQRSNEAEKGRLIERFWKVLARLLVMDCRTVAVINGHGFGAGLFLALACDFRIMRTNRGYICWPEINLGMRLAKGFSELTKAKVTDPKIIREGVLTGKRYGSVDAIKAGLIDEECPIEELVHRGELLAIAGLPKNLKLQNFNPRSFQQIKIELYCDAYRALTSGKYDDPPESRL